MSRQQNLRFTLLLLLYLLITANAIDGGARCANLANKIVRENCLPGTDSTVWDVNGGGDPTIQGFSTDISINIGNTVYFKIDTPSSKWRMDIFRLGFYNGSGARLVDTVYPLVDLPQTQPACYKEPDTNLVDCGAWEVSAKWHVPEDAISGLYIARPVREDTVADTYSKEGMNWRNDNSFQRGDRTHAKPGDDDYALPEKGRHAYGATGFGKLRNAIKGM